MNLKIAFKYNNKVVERRKVRVWNGTRSRRGR